MSENPELLHACASQLIADARSLDPTEALGRTFIARGVILAAFELSGNDYGVFRDTLPTLINHSDEYLERVFPDIHSTRNVRRRILASIRPRTRTQPLPETCVELLEGLVNNQFYFSDMPEQRYPIVARDVA